MGRSYFGGKKGAASGEAGIRRNLCGSSIQTDSILIKKKGPEVEPGQLEQRGGKQQEAGKEGNITSVR